MSSNQTLALSLQQQYALEFIAEQSGLMAASLIDATTDASPEQLAAMGDAYGTLLLGAMLAAAATRLGYLQEVAGAEGMSQFDIPLRVLEPSINDVLVGPNAPSLPVARGVGSGLPAMRQFNEREPSPEGGMWAALARLEKNLNLNDEQAHVIARNDLQEYTGSTVHATADWVDRMVLAPDQRIVALRRIAHPTACDRCMAVAGALVFKERPRLRHPQCACSFAPIFITDEDYTARLAKYRSNAAFTHPGSLGRDTRSRGRQQLEDAKFREESVWLKEEWTGFLRAEQQRLSRLVQTKPSTQYRDWAVMVSVKITESDSAALPVFTRE